MKVSKNIWKKGLVKGFKPTADRILDLDESALSEPIGHLEDSSNCKQLIKVGEVYVIWVNFGQKNSATQLNVFFSPFFDKKY